MIDFRSYAVQAWCGGDLSDSQHCLQVVVIRLSQSGVAMVDTRQFSCARRRSMRGTGMSPRPRGRLLPGGSPQRLRVASPAPPRWCEGRPRGLVHRAGERVALAGGAEGARAAQALREGWRLQASGDRTDMDRNAADRADWLRCDRPRDQRLKRTRTILSRRRRTIRPSAPKPDSSIAQLAGSGTGVMVSV